jgi:HlyD family secretion protein
MNMKKYLPIAVIVLAVIVSALYFDVFRYLGGDKSKIEGSGTIEVTEIEISSKVAGRVVSLPVGEGSVVRKDDLVVKLNYDELSAQRSSAEANLVNAQKNLERMRQLFKKGVISDRELENAEMADKVSRANVNLVSATIGSAVIYSPIDGVVLEKNLEIGEMAFPGSAILTLADLKKPWINIYIDEKKLGVVKLGQKAYIKVDSLPDKKFPGVVTFISHKAEFTPRTIQTKDERVNLMYAVKIAIENPEMELKPGMPADATILLERKK